MKVKDGSLKRLRLDAKLLNYLDHLEKGEVLINKIRCERGEQMPYEKTEDYKRIL